jgi:hypothetical protein
MRGEEGKETDEIQAEKKEKATRRQEVPTVPGRARDLPALRRSGVIPEVLVGTGLKSARRLARACASQVQEQTGCHIVAVVAEIGDDGRACTSMAVDPALEDSPEAEVALMKCALARVMSLLVLHCGYEDAIVAAAAAAHQGARLARLAEEAEEERAREEG